MGEIIFCTIQELPEKLKEIIEEIEMTEEERGDWITKHQYKSENIELEQDTLKGSKEEIDETKTTEDNFWEETKS